MPRAYYNEKDSFAAEWLKILITFGMIAEGDVDTRSIEDVEPSDLRSYTQCHFFAGIGGWSYALRLAGWPDSRPVWTGSCPCQPFSAAGKGGGFSDERHLWPSFDYLIGVCRPIEIFGEQVASKDGLNWLDVVFDDLEAKGYCCAAADICAAGIGAPHIRQRLYFAAHSMFSGWSERRPFARVGPAAWGSRYFCGVGTDAASSRFDGPFKNSESSTWHQTRLRMSSADSEISNGVGTDAELSNGRPQSSSFANSQGRDGLRGLRDFGNRDDGVVTGLEERTYRTRRDPEAGWLDADTARSIAASGPTRGFWADCDWWHGRDEKFRPIEPGLFPLAHGVSGRVGKLRGYGNAIVPQVAAEFIKAWQEVTGR